MADVSALLAEYRRRADDAGGKMLVSDEEAIRMFAEAEREACMRGYPIFDQTSLALTRYTILASQTIVRLRQQVLNVAHAAFTPTGTTRECSVDLVGIDELGERRAGRDVTSARPFCAAHSSRYELTLFPGPSNGGTLRLEVYRLPLLDLEEADDEPEIPLELHDGLVDWALYRTYSSKDGEQEDPARAARALTDFTDRFGERRDADAMRRHRERRRITTRMAR